LVEKIEDFGISQSHIIASKNIFQFVFYFFGAPLLSRVHVVVVIIIVVVVVIIIVVVLKN